MIGCTLIVAEPGDVFAELVALQTDGVVRCSGRQLLRDGRLSVFQDGTCIDGSFTIHNRKVHFAEMAGVLFRPSGQWRASAVYGKRIRAFIEHETRAAWCAALAVLPCPVVNRMLPGWWVDDHLHAGWLAQTLSERIGVRLAKETNLDLRETTGSASGLEQEATSIYVVGDAIVPIGRATAAIDGMFARQRQELMTWQATSGITFARIDFAVGATVTIKLVDPFPRVAEVCSASLQLLASSVAALLRDSRHR